MFALLAAIVFAVKVFGGSIGSLDLIALGLCLMAIHLLVGMWPFTAIKINRRAQ